MYVRVWMDGWIDRWMNGWMDGLLGGRRDVCRHMYVLTYVGVPTWVM